MAESGSLSSFSDTDSSSVLSGSAYYSTEISEDDDALSSPSLSLPMEEVWPYMFEPERSPGSEYEETPEVDHPGAEWLGNTEWYVDKDFSLHVWLL